MDKDILMTFPSPGATLRVCTRSSYVLVRVLHKSITASLGY